MPIYKGTEMDRSKYPLDKLRSERELRGWSQRRVATAIGTSEKRVSAWELGESAPGPHFREKLCLLFGKNTLELGLQAKRAPTSPLSVEDHTGCFAFGTLETTWMVIDGDGVESYLPQHIRSHYIPSPQELPAELQVRKELIEREQEQRREQGLHSFWNGEIYALDRFIVGREATNENMTLNLWFRPSDYYTFLATNMSLKEPALREKYLSDIDLYETIPHFSHSFGVSLAVVTSDGYTLFTQRGKHVGSRPRVYETSVVEGLSRPIDRSTTSEAPDVYRCACRGLAEELGLHEAIDFSVSDITFLSFGVDTYYGLRGLTGIVKIKKSIEKLLRLWDNGVRDKFENQKLFPIPFTPQDVVAFAYSHQPFAPGPTLYHALIHEFGREEVESALAREC